MILKFANNMEIEYTDAIETEEFYNGSSRRTLTFELDPKESVDSLNSIVSNEANTASIVLSNEELGVSNIYDGYVLKLRLGIEPKLIDADTNTYEDVLILKLGKRTYIEEQLHRLGL